MSLQKMEYPSWHDKARRMRDEGKTHAQIADVFGVSQGRISQIATPNWKSYILAWRAPTGNRPTIGEASKDVSKYQFVPIEEPSPREREEHRRKEKKSKLISNAHEIEMAREREFKQVKKLHEGKMLVGAEIVCSGCEKVGEYYNYRGSVTPSHLPKEFERMGWAVGKSHRADKCPECLARLKAKPSDLKADKPIPSPAAEEVTKGDILAAKTPIAIPEKKEEPMFVAAKTPEPLSSQIQQQVSALNELKSTFTPPPAITLPKEKAPEAKLPVVVSSPMTRTDRRIVFAKLDEVYIDETVGYRDDWDDTKVALDLGVSVEWIKDVREAEFGPEITKASRDKAAADIVKLIEDGERMVVLIDKKTEQLQALDNKMKEHLEAMDAAIDRAEQLSKSIDIEDQKMAELFRRFDGQVDEFKKMAADFRRSPSA